MTIRSEPREELIIPLKRSPIQPIGEPLAFTLEDLGLKSSLIPSRHDYVSFTTVQWKTARFGLDELDDVISEFARQDDVWNSSFLNCTTA